MCRTILSAIIIAQISFAHKSCPKGNSGLTAFSLPGFPLVNRKPELKNRPPIAMTSKFSVSDLSIKWNNPDRAGGFGAVYFGETRCGKEVVVKLAFKDEFAERLLQNELYFNEKLTNSIPPRHGRRWATLIGKCRPPYIHGLPKEVSSSQILIFRREQGRTLDEFLSKDISYLEQSLHVPTNPIGSNGPRVHLFVKILGELLCSIVQLHRAGLVHRDVKPENVFIVPSDRSCPLKLLDLGSACDMGATLRRGLTDDTVDPLYAPPELKLNRKYPWSFDVFCIAVTALRALLPAFSKSTTELRKMMEEELPAVDYNFEQWCINKISTSDDELSRQVFLLLDKKNEWIVKLLQPMLAKNPACRPEPKEVLKKLGPVWAATLHSVEILSPAAPPLDRRLPQRLMQEMRMKPHILFLFVIQAAKFLLEKFFLPLIFRFIPRVLGCINRSFVASVTKRIGLAV